MAVATQKPHKYFDDQFDDENVLFVFRQHPIVMRKGILLWGVGMLAGPVYTVILTIIYANNPAKYPTMGFFFTSIVLSFVLACLLIMPSYIGWYFSVFIVTDQRFIQIKQKGLFHRSVADLTLQQIQSVNYEVAGLQETLLGFGTIKMQTYVGDLTIKDVHHPAKIQKRMLALLREQGVTTSPYQARPKTIQSNDEETPEAEEA
jgi:uncharacterized membrane protein YdbT with pleckstrin-like domain